MQASNNNRASTVLKLYQDAIANYNLPSRVRSDYGMENIDVGQGRRKHLKVGGGAGCEGHFSNEKGHLKTFSGNVGDGGGHLKKFSGHIKIFSGNIIFFSRK